VASQSLPPLDIQRAPEGGEIGAIQSGWRLALREFMSNRLAVIGFGILIFFVLFCFIGPYIYRTDQIDTNLILANQPPSAAHILGTDTNGFDELGRIMKGGQAALEIGFFAAFVAIVIGTLWGAVSGLVGGVVDSAMMRVVDVFLSVPFLFVVLILAVKFGATVLSLSLVIGGFAWQVPARLVRGEVLWGDQLADGSGYLQDGYWWLIFPVGACIVLTVMGLNFIGDALRDALDVRLRRR
jgi:ABC-type dipeptide/oligopeptide/nickel transport system permease subunit